VIEWGQTKTEVVETALESARGVYERLLGVVLNKTDINLLRRFENYRGHYYNERYNLAMVTPNDLLQISQRIYNNTHQVA